MTNSVQDDHVRLIQALSRYLGRSAAPTRVTVDQRLDLIAGIVERESSRQRIDLISNLHKIELKLQAMELRFEELEEMKFSEQDHEIWHRHRLAWLIGIAAGVASIMGLLVRFFN